MVRQFFSFFSLKKIFQTGLKFRTIFLESRRFFRHPYRAKVIIMAEMVIMAIMAKLAIMAITPKMITEVRYRCLKNRLHSRNTVLDLETI